MDLSQTVNQTNQAIDQANQMNTAIMWIIIAAPVLVLFVSVIVAIIVQRQRKCPKCGNMRNNVLGRQTSSLKNSKSIKITTRHIVVCAKCGHEFYPVQ